YVIHFIHLRAYPTRRSSDLIRKHNKFIKVDEVATPLLVPAIEEGFKNHPITHSIIYNYLSNKKLKNIETLILGCTHYPLLIDERSEEHTSELQSRENLVCRL